MIEVAPVEVGELERVVAVHNAVQADDPTTVPELVDWRRQAEDMVWLVATADGEDAGGGIGVIGWHAQPQTALLELWTLPAARRRGVGSALLEKLRRWSAERGCPATEASVAENDRSSLAWAKNRGYREIGGNSSLVLDLEVVEPPTVDPPDGIEIATWAERPGIERELYAVYVEAEPDIPGEESNELPAFEKWLSNDMQGHSDRADAVFVAFAGQEVVGYAKLALRPQSTRAYHDLTGVKRAWRGRGIAGALKRAQIAWAKEQGYERLVTGNEVRNEPIRRLNERHGYRVEPGTIRVRSDS